jgi:AcrR family transcriptional regulator
MPTDHATPTDATASHGYPRKRARTRRQLMTAGMAVLADHGPDGTTVGAVARRARVAPGTFYNHFDDLDALIGQIVDELVTGVEIARELLVEVEHDAAARVAIGSMQLLALAADDPPTARAFTTLIATVPTFRTRVRGIVRGAITDGIEQGRFITRSADITADAVIGAVVQWMRTRLTGEQVGDDVTEHLALVLRIAGYDGDDDRAIAERIVATTP